MSTPILAAALAAAARAAPSSVTTCRLVCHGSVGSGLGPDDGRRLLRAWMSEMELGLDTGGLLSVLQADDFSHSDLERRARRVHERKLTAAIEELLATGGTDGLEDAAATLFAACLPAVPYIPAATFLAREQANYMFEPPLAGVGLRDWRAFDRCVAEGYQHALRVIDQHGVPLTEVWSEGPAVAIEHRATAAAE